MDNEGEVFQVVTANLLRDGTIVYMQLGDCVKWVANIADATTFDEQTIESALEKGNQSATNCKVVGVYAIEVAGRNRPLTAKEIIRAKGPSIKYGHAAIAPDFSI